MKVKNRFKINNTFIASAEIMKDRCETDSDKRYWEKSIEFIKQVIDLDFSQLSKPQINWITNIRMELRKEGYIK
jgi:hypothetical protein